MKSRYELFRSSLSGCSDVEIRKLSKKTALKEHLGCKESSWQLVCLCEECMQRNNNMHLLGIMDAMSDIIDIKNPELNLKDLFIYKAHGDSMKDTVNNGDILLAKNNLKPQNNSLIIAKINNISYVKRYLHKKGKIVLISDNPDYKNIKLKNNKFEVLGIVQAVFKKLFMLS